MSTSIKDLNISCTGIDYGLKDFEENRRKVCIEIGNFNSVPAEKWLAELTIQLNTDGSEPVLRVTGSDGTLVGTIPFQKGKSSW